jgi:hypothetical protein
METALPRDRITEPAAGDNRNRAFERPQACVAGGVFHDATA